MRRIVVGPGLCRAERDLLLRCVWMYARFESQDARKFDTILSEIENEEMREMKMTMAEWWQKQAREEGRQEGLAEGARDMVLRLLSQRFGSLSSGVRRRVAAIASADELSRLAERAYQVESLEELGLA